MTTATQQPDGISSRNENAAPGPAASTPYHATPADGHGSTAHPACRAAAHGFAHPGRREPLSVEIDHGSTSSRGRPAGHVWLVRLRRGDQQAIIAIGLGRPSAEHLARQIRDVMDPPPLAAPPQTR